MKRKILIITGIFPPDIGGPASFVSALAHHLQTHAWDVTVLTLADPPFSTDEWPFRVIRIPRNTALPWRMLRFANAVCKLSGKADLVFCNALYFETRLGLKGNRPLICKIVSDQIYDRRALKSADEALDPLAFQDRALSGLEKAEYRLRYWALKKARIVVTPSHYFKRVAARFLPTGTNITVIPNACQPMPLGITPKKSHHLVMICRLIPAKNVATALHALALLPADYHLTVIGEGPFGFALKKLAQDLGLEDRVRFSGRLNRAAAMKILESAAFLLMLSSYENFPHTVIEAFQTQTLVIANPVGGIPEIIEHGHNGVLLKRNTPEELADILHNLKTEAIDKMVASACESGKNYQPERIFAAYEQLFLT